jgi:hypothetical protein
VPNQTEILTALSTLILALLGAALIAVTSVLIPWLKAKSASLQYETANKIARDAVHETEQLAASGGIPTQNASNAKLANAESAAMTIAGQYGVRLPRGSVTTLIESNVLTMKRNQQAADTPTVDVSPVVEVTNTNAKPMTATATRTRRKPAEKATAEKGT